MRKRFEQVKVVTGKVVFDRDITRIPSALTSRALVHNANRLNPYCTKNANSNEKKIFFFHPNFLLITICTMKLSFNSPCNPEKRSGSAF